MRHIHPVQQQRGGEDSYPNPLTMGWLDRQLVASQTPIQTNYCTWDPKQLQSQLLQGGPISPGRQLGHLGLPSTN